MGLFKRRPLQQSTEIPRARMRSGPVDGNGRETRAFSYYASSRRTITEADHTSGQLPRNRSMPYKPHAGLTFLQWLRRFVYRAAWVVCLGVLLWYALSVGSSAAVTVVQSDTKAVLPHAAEEYRVSVNKAVASKTLNRFKLLFNAEDIRTAIQRQYPELERVEVHVPLIGRTPHVKLFASASRMAIINHSKAYILSGNGYIQGVTDSASLAQNQIKIVDLTNAVPQAGKQYLPARTVQFIQSVDYQLARQQRSVDLYTLPANNAYEVDVRLRDKPYIVRYNLQENAREQCGTFAATVATLKGDSKIKEYIDVRVPGRAYYK